MTYDDGWRGTCKFCDNAVFWHGDGDDEAIFADDNWHYYHLRCLPKGQHMPDVMTLYWRPGRKLGRTIYAIVEQENGSPLPSDNDIFLGMFDDPGVAHAVCEAHNSVLVAEKVVGGLTPQADKS